MQIRKDNIIFFLNPKNLRLSASKKGKSDSIEMYNIERFNGFGKWR